MRKRVALAAALINEPSILLMDEPFGALDVQTKAIMSNELLTLWDQSKPSVIFVTHDLEEAIALADKVVVMTAGPGTVKAVFDIDLPRPRGSVQEIRFGQRFTELHHEIWESLRDEVTRAYARTSALAGLSPAVEEVRVMTTTETAGARRAGRAAHHHVRRLAAVHVAEDRGPVLLRPAQRDRVARPGLGAARHQLRARSGSRSGPPWRKPSSGSSSGSAGGIVVGVLLGQVRFLSEVLSPYIKAVNALPRIVLGALFIIILGLGMSSKVVLAAFLVFFVVFFNAYQGVREVDGNLVNNARILGASRMQVIRNVVIPSAMTWIIASLHVAFGFAVIGAVVGEVLGAQHGLGVLITDSANNFNTDGIFAGMIIIGAIALVAEWLISLLERRLLAWRPQMATEASAV